MTSDAATATRARNGCLVLPVTSVSLSSAPAGKWLSAGLPPPSLPSAGVACPVPPRRAAPRRPPPAGSSPQLTADRGQARRRYEHERLGLHRRERSVLTAARAVAGH